jgi:non-ribosomal peptide synthetase component F
VALVCGEERLSYGELEQRANRLARYLRGLGVGPEVLVGLCVERSVEMLVGMLGILAAGGAYVPLDPAYPPQRLAFILEDSQAPVLVTQNELLPGLPEHGARVARLDGDAPRIAQESAEPLPPANPAVTAGNLAYIIYTSGSTGRPKGVAIQHRSAANLAGWAQRVFPAEDLAGVLAATSICFDLSVFEIFVPLAAGGTVILSENALALPELPAAASVTLVNTVPSAIAQLLDALPASVRTVSLAGEPLRPQLVDEIYRRGVRRVFDLYGPSEDTTYSTFTLRARGGR